MSLWITQLCEGLTYRWAIATPADVARVSLLMVVLAWFLAREHLYPAIAE
ncbi:MAG: hypothetical protein ACT4QC_18060 [Planctomycetaceae bacterium]